MADLTDGGIYTIEHTSGKLYVGSAKNIKHRWAQHKSDLRRGAHHSLHLQRAWNKHGEGAFKFRKRVTVRGAKDLVSTEQIYLDCYRSFEPARGYNMSPTAGSPLGVKQSAETIEKRMLKLRGRVNGPHTEERKAAMRRAWETRSRTLSPEHRAKISAASRGVPRPPEGVAKSSRTRRAQRWASVSAAKVPEIRARCAAGEKQCVVAKLYGVSTVTVSLIVNNKIWKQ